MILRPFLSSVGRAPAKMVRVLQTPDGSWIPFERWEKAERQRIELERAQRMPQSGNELCDMSHRIPGKADYDMTQ